MSALRIGYVNVRGLANNKWLALLALLKSGSYDLLFVAETWYVGHEFFSLDRHFIASTTQSERAKEISSRAAPVVVCTF